MSNPTKTEKIELRVTLEAKRAVESAASARNQSTSQFVLMSVMKEIFGSSRQRSKKDD